jgi:hypothetical protein
MNPIFCPECGAGFPPGEECVDRFNACLALEFENPGSYGAVHHLTVATYMLQHPSRYSREGWLATRKLLVDFLRNGKTTEQVRRENRRRFEGGNKTWSMTKGERIQGLEEVSWSRTIGDVRLENPQVYCADVERWAQSFLEDTEEILPRIYRKP